MQNAKQKNYWAKQSDMKSNKWQSNNRKNKCFVGNKSSKQQQLHKITKTNNEQSKQTDDDRTIEQVASKIVWNFKWTNEFDIILAHMMSAWFTARRGWTATTLRCTA